jgi:hypothetical protein
VTAIQTVINCEVETSRWPCASCGGPLRLVFIPSDEDEGSLEIDEAFCKLGHEVPQEVLSDIGVGAAEELRRALEEGTQIASVWKPPDEEGQTGAS